MQGEAMSQDPVYFKDMVRVVLGSIITDFVNGRTATTYTPLYQIDQVASWPATAGGWRRRRCGR